jgi:hypothetical protein
MATASDTGLSPETAALLASVSSGAAKLVAVLLEQKAADPRMGVPRKVSQEMGGWGSTTQIEKEKRGDLQTFLDGMARRVFVPSIYDHLIALAIASHHVGAPEKKARQPAARYQRRPRREPTQAELEALKSGNERRRREPEAHRAGAQARRPKPLPAPPDPLQNDSRPMKPAFQRKSNASQS